MYSLVRAALAALLIVAAAAVPLPARQPNVALAGSWNVTIEAFGEARTRATGTLDVKANAEGSVSVTLTIGSLKETIRDARVDRGGVELTIPDHNFIGGVVSDQELANRLGIAVGTLVGTYVYAPGGKGDYKSGWRATRRADVGLPQ